jgi:hypothetical protein
MANRLQPIWLQKERGGGGGAEEKESAKRLSLKLYFIHATSLCNVALDIDIVQAVSKFTLSMIIKNIIYILK